MKLFRLIFVVILLIGCESNFDSLLTPEKVINDTLLEIVGTDFYYESKPPPPFAPPHPDSVDWCNEISGDIEIILDKDTTKVEPTDCDSIYRAELAAYEKFDWESYEKRYIEWKEAIPKLDSSSMILYVFDTLISAKNQHIRRYLDYDSVLFQLNYGLSEKYYDLYIKLSIAEKRRFDLRQIIKTDRYQIKPESAYQKPKLGQKQVGALTYSNVVFNKSEKLACFYVSFVCGGHCGFGLIAFARLNENEFWEIVYAKEVWVS